VVRALWRQQRLPTAVESDPVQVLEVGVAPRLLPRSHEVDGPRFVIDAQNVVDVPFPARDPVLETAGGEIVQIKVEPVVALGPPDQLVRRGQHAPQVLGQRRIADLGAHALLKQGAHLAGLRVGDADPGALVVA
jgi:hypothetical protein